MNGDGARPAASATASHTTKKASEVVDHHRAGDGDAIGVGERVRGLEQEHEQQHADQHQAVDARHEDLPLGRLRRVLDLHAGQQAELDRLPDRARRRP